MEYIKQNFSIKDLEHLSGIKAHTIRIWEKRYNILNPDRTDTNIRSYDIESLQKILNVTFLNDHGYKISRIAKLTDEEIANMVKNVAATASLQNQTINSLKISMINFDEALFHNIYSKLLERKSFRQIFHEIFLPLLDQIGLLWQTETINPVHEHFLVELIKQKLYINMSQVGNLKDRRNEDLYVLFLPENEIHDLGLLYLNYELKFNGCRTIFLGPSMPIKDMKYILEIHPNPAFITYLTVAPMEVSELISEFEAELCRDNKKTLHLFGRRTQEMEQTAQPEHIKIYKSITQFATELE